MASPQEELERHTKLLARQTKLMTTIIQEEQERQTQLLAQIASELQELQAVNNRIASRTDIIGLLALIMLGAMACNLFLAF